MCGARCFRVSGNGNPHEDSHAGKRPVCDDGDAAHLLKRFKAADEQGAGEEPKQADDGKEQREDEWRPLEQDLFTFATTMFGLEDSCACARLVVRPPRR